MQTQLTILKIMKTEENTVTKENSQFVRPRVNLYGNDEAFYLEAEMPGVAKGGLDITYNNGLLTITGKRHDSKDPWTPLHRESLNAHYKAAFELSDQIDPNKISASLTQGVLKVNLPRQEKVKPRQITIAA